jgi:hypothetical protein
MRRPLAVNVAGGFTSGRKRTRFALAFFPKAIETRRSLERGIIVDEKQGRRGEYLYDLFAASGHRRSSFIGAWRDRRGNPTWK